MGTTGKSWQSFRDVLLYLKKSEDNKDDELAKSEYHSKGGYLTVENIDRFPLLDIIMKGCKKVLRFNPDYNGEKQAGCVYYQNTKTNGQRCSTVKAFLNNKRSNLQISPLSHVHQINIDPDTKVNIGVTFKMENYTAFQQRGYIVWRSNWFTSGISHCVLISIKFINMLFNKCFTLHK